MEPGRGIAGYRREILRNERTATMRTLALWLIGIPIPIIILLWLFGAY